MLPNYKTAGRAAAKIEANCHIGALADVYSRISLVKFGRRQIDFHRFTLLNPANTGLVHNADKATWNRTKKFICGGLYQTDLHSLQTPISIL